jgi:hypothetical protein
VVALLAVAIPLVLPMLAREALSIIQAIAAAA